MALVNTGAIPSTAPWSFNRKRTGLGDLPPNIVRGCVTWDPATDTLDADRYVYRSGQPTGMRECGADGNPPIDVAMTVLSMPFDVFGALATVGIQSTAFNALEPQAQDLCRQALAVPGYGAGAHLGDLWTRAQALLQQANMAYQTASRSYTAFENYDDAAENGYSRGNYSDPQTGRLVIQNLQAWNHVPMAWDNISAATTCVHDALDDYVRGVRLGAFNDLYDQMSHVVDGVQAALGEAMGLLQQFQINVSRLTNPTQEIADALAAAQPSIDGLNALATQIGSIWQVAQDQKAQADAGAADLSNPVAVEQADDWIHNAYAPFNGAIGQAQAFAGDIHQKLDGVAQKVASYIAQNPDKLKDPDPALVGGGTGAKGKAGLWLGIGLVGAALLALKIKGGAAAAAALA